jgi:hypothetical protein
VRIKAYDGEHGYEVLDVQVRVSVTRVSQIHECYESVTRVLQACYKCDKRVINVFRECYDGEYGYELSNVQVHDSVTRVLQACY